MPHLVFRCLAMACVALAATAFAQQTPAPAARPSAQDAAPSSVYRSAWSGYRPFADEKVISWKDANDEVRRIGGWRAYLRESQSGQPSGSEGAARTAPASKDSAKEPSSDSGAAQRQSSHNASKESR
jgi:hypothetical protein